MTPLQVSQYLIGDEVLLDREALAALEAKLSVPIPVELLSFLELRNGGCTSPTASEKDPLSYRGRFVIEHFYCASNLPTDWNLTSIRNYKLITLRDLLDEIDGDTTNVPAHWLVFGQNWGGDQWAIDLSVAGGEVVYLDHEMMPLEEANAFPNEGTSRLGVNFAQFLEGLDPPPTYEGPHSGSLDRQGETAFVAFWRRSFG